MPFFNSRATLDISIDGVSHDISLEEIEIVEQQKGNYAVAREDNLTIALDTELTPELETEGIAREFVNRIQNLRKESNLQVMDRIRIFYDAPQRVDNAVSQMSDYIKTETLAVDLDNRLPSENPGQQVEIDTDTFAVSIEKV